MTFNAIVLQHFRHPLNRGHLPDANVSESGANPLCGDRLVIELRAESGVIREARFHADACALCVATASLLTEHVRGMTPGDITTMNESLLKDLLKAEPPPARKACTRLPLDTLQRAANRLLGMSS